MNFYEFTHKSTFIKIYFREGEREREKDQYESATSLGCFPYAPSRDQTRNLGTCPDQELYL